MDRPKENLRTEQKATIEMMYAEGKDEAAIAKAIGKRIDTVKHYIDGHIFELRDKSGRMPDGTPKAGREPVKQKEQTAEVETATVHIGDEVKTVTIDKELAQEMREALASDMPKTNAEVALDAMPEPVKEPEPPEVQPYRDWIIERIAVLQKAMIEQFRTMQELPEEWVSEYHTHISTWL